MNLKTRQQELSKEVTELRDCEVLQATTRVAKSF